MKDLTPEQRWAIQMVQARNFARKDQFADAVARAAGVRDEVARALEEQSDLVAKRRLERTLERVERQHAQLRAEFQAWRDRIEAGRQARMGAAAEEMAQPLPQSSR